MQLSMAPAQTQVVATPLGAPQVLVGLGDPFWQARPASELYRPSGPLRRKPPPREDEGKDGARTRAARGLREDEEEALREFAEFGDVDGVAEVLANAPSGQEERVQFVNAQTWSGWTALTYAAAAGHYEVVEMLLAAQADPEIRAVLNGCTPYMMACEMGHAAVVELLVAGGAEQEVVDEHWRNGRQLAERRKKTEVVVLLDKLEELALEAAAEAEAAAAAEAEAAAAAEAEAAAAAADEGAEGAEAAASEGGGEGDAGGDGGEGGGEGQAGGEAAAGGAADGAAPD